MKREQVEKCKYQDLMQFNCAQTAQLDILVRPGEYLRFERFMKTSTLAQGVNSDSAGAGLYVESRS